MQIFLGVIWYFFQVASGLYEGDQLRNWLVHNIYKQTGLIDPNFEELYRHTGKTLKIYGTNLNQGTLVEFSHINTPNESVTRAVLISSALPIAFKPKKNAQGEVLIDGGLIKNFPIDAYDFIDKDGTRYANPTTLGFLSRNISDDQSPDSSVLSYLHSIFDAVTHHETMSLSQRDLRRTIVVKCPKEISVTTMHLEKDQIDLLKKMLMTL